MSEAKRRKVSHGTAQTKLPAIEDFTSGEDVARRLSSRDSSVLAAALNLLEKRCLAICTQSAAVRSQDAAWQYSTAHPTADHVYAAWDTANRSNNSQLATAVLNALNALIRLTSCDPRAKEPPVLRRLVSQYGSHLERSLNPGRNDVTTAALKLCIVVASYGEGRFAKRLLRCMSWSPKVTARLYKTRLRDTSKSALARPDIRTLLVMLVLALLAHADSKFRTEIIETRGLVTGVLRGLSEDRDEVLNQVLNAIWRDVLSDRSIRLDTRRGLLDEGFINELVKLCDRDASTEKSDSLSARRFLQAASLWLSEHVDETRGRAFASQRILGTILRTLKVTDDAEQRELALQIIHRCPLLVSAYWSRFPAALEARLSSRWISAITLATRLIAAPHLPSLNLDYAKAAPPAHESVVDTLRPPQLTKQWYTKSLQSDSPLVSFLTALCFSATLQKAASTLELISSNASRLEETAQGRWSQLAHAVRQAVQDIAPDPQVILALVQKASTRTDREHDLRLNLYLRILWLYHRVVPDTISSLRFDYSKLSETFAGDQGEQVSKAWSASYALRLSALHSPTLTWSRPNEYYKVTLAPLLKLLRSTTTSTNRQLLLDSLRRLLDSQVLFNADSQDCTTVIDSLVDADAQVIDCFDLALQHALSRAANLSGFIEETNQTALSPFMVSALHLIRTSTSGAEEDKASAAFVAFARKLFFAFAASPAPAETLRQVAASVSKDASTSADLEACLSIFEGSEQTSDKKKKKSSRKSSASDASNRLSAVDDHTAESELLALALLTSSAPDRQDSILQALERRHGLQRAALVLLRCIFRAEQHSRQALSTFERVFGICDAPTRYDVARRAFASDTIGYAAQVETWLDSATALGKAIMPLVDRAVFEEVAKPPLNALDQKMATDADTKADLSRVVREAAPLLPLLPPQTIDKVLSAVLQTSSATIDDDRRHTLLALLAASTATTTDVPSWVSPQAVQHVLDLVDSHDIENVAADCLERIAQLAKPPSTMRDEALCLLVQSLLAIAKRIVSSDVLIAKLPGTTAACICNSAAIADAFEARLKTLKRVPPAVLAAFLEVRLACSKPIALAPEQLDAAVADSLASRNAKVLSLLAQTSNEAATSVMTKVGAWAHALAREERSAAELSFLDQLANNPLFAPTLVELVNDSLDGLVRRFAEDDEDTTATLQLVETLTRIVSTREISFKPHLLDPLMTAAITRRLDQVAPLRMIRLFAQSFTFSNADASRHLNSIFANKHYHALVASASEDYDMLRSEVLLLVTALSRAATDAALSTRTAERIMPLYGGTLSQADQAAIALLRQVEEKATNAVAISTKFWRPALDCPIGDDDIASRLSYLSFDKVTNAWWHAAGASIPSFDRPTDAYDATFLLPYAIQVLSRSESMKTDDWKPFLSSGLPGVAFAALASDSTDLRLHGRALLAALRVKLEMARINEKDELLLLIEAAQNSVYSAAGEAIPAIVAIFFAHCAYYISHPESSLYPHLVRFLLQRAIVDQRDVPLFYAMLYSSGDAPDVDHEWLLSYLTQGLVRSQDWRIMRRRQVFDLIASFFSSQSTGSKLRRLALSFLRRAASVRLSAHDLLYRHGILDWLSAQSFTGGEAVQVYAILEALLRHAQTSKRRTCLSMLPTLDRLSLEHPPATESTTLATLRIMTTLLAMLAVEAKPTELLTYLAVASRVLWRVPPIDPTQDAPAAQLYYTSVSLIAYLHSKSGAPEGPELREALRKGLRLGFATGLPALHARVLVLSSRDHSLT